MQEKAKEPEIRFAGFTGAWEQRKLSDIAERITRKNTHLESTLPLTISSSYGLIDQYAYFNNRVASRNTRNYYLIKNGEFAYNKSYSDGFPFGSVKRLDRYAMGVLSTLYIIFSIDYRKVNSDFLVSYYDTKNWHHQVALRAAEGARNHGLLNISADDFFETELKIPMNLDEQKKIGSFFDQLNSFITLHQRKYEKLLNIKKSMLEKMFPKEGEVVPEIRFKGFTGAWEQRKIGDYLTLSKIPGHTGVDAKKLTVKLWGKGVVEKTDIYGGSQNTQYYVRRAGQFMYGKLDFLHAAFGIVPKSLDRFESTLDSPAFDLHEIDGAFLQNRVTQQNFYLKFGNIANGSRKAKRIHEVTFLDMPIVVPSYAEQKKIGAFLNKLDSLLTLHQRQQNGGYLWLENSAKQVCFAIITASGYRSTKKALSDQLR